MTGPDPLLGALQNRPPPHPTPPHPSLKKIYINPQARSEGDGTQGSPYKTLGRAMQDIPASTKLTQGVHILVSKVGPALRGGPR